MVCVKLRDFAILGANFHRQRLCSELDDVIHLSRCVCSPSDTTSVTSDTFSCQRLRWSSESQRRAC
jgi:hypothetical protein